MTGFSAALRAATWTDHQRSEDTAYLRALVSGGVDRQGYAEMVAQHWYAYVVLEEAAQVMRDDPVAGGFVTPALDRVPALERDLAALLGPEWSTVVSPSPATQRYCDRLREVCFGWPGGFVAHHYTRYLGDLSGGQIIRDRAEKAWGFARKGDGVHFYVFDEIPNPAAFKRSYRDTLDAIPADDLEKQRIVAECRRAFALNTAVFTGLDREFRPLSA
jgi:heme oxygenase (biliverdin-producing, ferredoxin)